MRHVLEKVLKEKLPEHMGLAYDVWAPVSTQGTIDEAERDGWFDKLSKWNAPGDYRFFFQHWENLTKEPHFRVEKIEAASRLLIGHGNAAPSEVGLTVHHTWGVPMIPGSALKGLLSHYVDVCFGPSWKHREYHPRSPEHPEKERAPYAGVRWKGNRIEMGPGAIHQAIFGAPDADTDELHPETGAFKGLVTFHDALWIPGTPSLMPFARDILTPHQKTYYTGEGVQEPNDYDDPNPVAFLTVRPKAQFLVCLSGPSDWVDLAMALLLDALEEWGVGAKTVAGYGRLISVSKSRNSSAATSGSSSTEETFQQTINYNKGNKKISIQIKSEKTKKTSVEADLEELVKEQQISAEFAQKIKESKKEVEGKITIAIDGNNVKITRIELIS